MKLTTTTHGFTAWLGGGALAGMLILGVPLTSAQAQDTSAVQRDTSKQAAATDTIRRDSTQWGRTADRDAEVQNPPGYRGMERPVNVFPPDTADTSSAADATSRTSQMKRQDTVSSENQNPPGYRGMERPIGTDSARAQQVETEFIGTSSNPTVRARWRALLEAALNQPNPTRELQDAMNKLRKAETTKKATTKKTKSKKKATTQRDTTSADTTMRRDTTGGQQTEMRQPESSQTDSDSAATVRVGQDTTGDTTRYEVNSQEGRSATDRTGGASADSTDVIHRERETPPGVGYNPPPYPADSEQVWVKQQPSGDSVSIGFDSTANNQ
jgi:hypothetical protein